MRRLIHTLSCQTTEVRLYRDSEWQEYQADLVVNGVVQEAARYHTGDWADVLGTGKVMLHQAVAHAGMDEMAGI